MGPPGSLGGICEHVLRDQSAVSESSRSKLGIHSILKPCKRERERNTANSDPTFVSDHFSVPSKFSFHPVVAATFHQQPSIRRRSDSNLNAPTTAMASPESNVADHVVELIVRDASSSLLPPPPSSGDTDDAGDDQIAPLLSHPERPKINIFTASYPRRKPRVIPFFTFILLFLNYRSFLFLKNGKFMQILGVLCMGLIMHIYVCIVC